MNATGCEIDSRVIELFNIFISLYGKEVAMSSTIIRNALRIWHKVGNGTVLVRNVVS